MSEAEFWRVLIRVIAVGTLVIGIGTVALVFAFRALGGENEKRGILILVGAIVFILMITFVLFRWSYGAN